jgi:methyl-accepting chemotaxis protein
LVELWTGPEVAAQTSALYSDASPLATSDNGQLADAGVVGAYSAVHSKLHKRTSLFVTERGYYDFFLISPAGDIMYTVQKEPDFATNLRDGPWRDSALAEVFRKTMATAESAAAERVITISDMRTYGPSDGAPAIFIATAMYDDGGQSLGAIVFQLPTDRILDIMYYTGGMGETGETYLVGQDGLMRSDSRFNEASTVLKQVVETPTSKAALAGAVKQGYITDYRGVEVMSVGLPMTVDDVHWAVMAEIDRSEIEEWAAEQRPVISGPLLFIYGLSLWSVWYWRNRRLPDDDSLGGAASVDLGDSQDFGAIDS